MHLSYYTSSEGVFSFPLLLTDIFSDCKVLGLFIYLFIFEKHLRPSPLWCRIHYVLTKKPDNIIFVVPLYTKLSFKFIFGTDFEQLDYEMCNYDFLYVSFIAYWLILLLNINSFQQIWKLWSHFVSNMFFFLVSFHTHWTICPWLTVRTYFQSF